MGKREDVTQQTRQNLIDAFWALYCEKRIEKITVKDITSKAGYNRSTFYEYFSDAYDVLEQLQDTLMPTLEAIPQISESMPIGSFGMPMDTFMKLYEQNAKYYSVLLGENGDPAFASKIKKKIKPLLMLELGVHTSIDSTKLDFILEYTLTAMIGIMSYWFNHESSMTREDLHQLIRTLSQEGILNQLRPSQQSQ